MLVAPSSPVPVGSSIFFTFALLAISILVLLVLRRFLTLRATPAYLSVPVFLALALPASVVLLVPIDLASSSRLDNAPQGIWLPDRVVLVCWRITYWLIFVLTWFVLPGVEITPSRHLASPPCSLGVNFSILLPRAILPLLGEFVDSGYREPKARMLYSLRSNGRYQLVVLSCAIAGLIYISIQNGFEFKSIKAIAMALAYVWGLVLAIYLMGHGLVSIPRSLFRHASASGRLRRLQTHAPRVHDRLIDGITDLEILEAQVAQLQRHKRGVSPDIQEWIEDLAETCKPMDARSAALSHASDASAVPAVITERFLADLTRRLQRARHQKIRFIDEWERLVRTAARLQAIINSGSSKQLEFPQLSQSSAAGKLGRIKILTPQMRYHIYVNVLPAVYIGFGGIFAAATVCIIWSELSKSLAPDLSVISRTVVPRRASTGQIGLGGQVAASVWLLYMCAAALVGVNDAKVWGNRALVRRNTYGESACWYASLVARLTVPLAYNFLTFLPKHTRQETTFYHFLGRLIDLTPLGKGFDYIFPVFILLPVSATLFNLYGRVKNVFGFGLADEDDPEFAANGSVRQQHPSGRDWSEGRELIQRELNGLGALALWSSAEPSTSHPLSATAASEQQERLLSEHGGGPSMRRERLSGADSTRSSRLSKQPAGRAVQNNNINNNNVDDDDDESDENVFQAFAHRVRNTLETTSRPQWFQGEPFRLPRWMSNDETRRRDGGLARLFGGRLPDGRVRL